MSEPERFIAVCGLNFFSDEEMLIIDTVDRTVHCSTIMRHRAEKLCTLLNRNVEDE